MQFVEINDLKPGMRLAKPIYNKMGVMLYDRNSFLTRSGIKSIENFGLIGLFILEPAEPLPPLSKEDIEFEQFQVVYMFRIKEIMDCLQKNQPPQTLPSLAADIVKKYGSLDHKMNFVQTLRGSADFVYKHAISTAILCAMIANAMNLKDAEKLNLTTAALLYDLGYLYVPREILSKRDLSADDRRIINEYRKKGFQLLNPATNPYNINPRALAAIQQTLTMLNISDEEDAAGKSFSQNAYILTVADQFDRLTAMSLDHAPLSEIAAVRELKLKPALYHPSVVFALSKCVHILPSGCNVDLSNGDKGIVIADNPDNFLAPMVLNIRDNQIYDLSDPTVAEKIQIVDIMKTMDNRIVVDEETLTQFSADPALTDELTQFKKKMAEKTGGK